METLSAKVFQRLMLVLALGAIACSPSDRGGDNGDAGDSLADIQLKRLAFSPLQMETLSVVILHVKATNSNGEPQAGVPIVWSFPIAPPASVTITSEIETDATGVASVTVGVADVMDSFVVRASLPGSTSSVEWELEPYELRLRGVGSPPDVTVADAPLGQKVAAIALPGQTLSLRVQLTQLTGIGEVPVPNKKISFQLSRAITGTSLTSAADPTFLEVTSGATGHSAAELKAGATTGSIKVLATYGNLPPVQFDVTVTIP